MAIKNNVSSNFWSTIVKTIVKSLFDCRIAGVRTFVFKLYLDQWDFHKGSGHFGSHLGYFPSHKTYVQTWARVLKFGGNRLIND